MKRILKLTVFMLLIGSINLLAQQADSLEVGYDYRIETAGETSFEGDTIYNAEFLIDSAALEGFEEIIIEGDNKQKEVSVKSIDIANDPRFTKQGSKYRYDGGSWEGSSEYKLKGKKKDQNEEYLKSKRERKKLPNKEIHREKPRSLKRATSIENPAEEQQSTNAQSH